MTDLYFFYGTLCHPPLLERVLGRLPALHPAMLAGHEAREACGADGAGLGFPILVPGAGPLPGLLAEITAAEGERLAFYETGYHTAELRVTDATGAERRAKTWLPEPGRWHAGAPWRLADWAAERGALATEAAAEFIALEGQLPAEAALARYPMIKVRAASRLRAANPAPARVRRSPAPGDVVVEALRTPYAKFFAVEDYTLRHRLFSGGMSAPLQRAAFVSGDATVVLPYDPVRDRVLLVEQFRTGPFARGDANPWSIEAVAGRVDPGETPEEAARREAAEEAGVTLSQLLPAPNFYPTPGAKSEYLYCFIGLADLPDGCAGFGGLEAEGEDIRAHLVGFDTLMELVESGEAENAPLVVLALWLAQKRASLRAAAGAAG
ncbi:MAG: NUDIX domain-containing protein [Paenirhodobacter sp.]|uniref:NUDIX domain-containing protein n=1 Tax=Paenirhodobacter sp. TaxID=1965326 RepID=UPI003D106B4B